MNMPNKIGIYGLRCKSTNKWYVRQSWNVEDRWTNYYQKFKCKRQPKIYNALMKYGYDDFEKVILEETCPSQLMLDRREIYWSMYYDSINNGYNLRVGGARGLCSKETKQRIKEKRHWQIFTTETRLKMSISQSKRIFPLRSEETKKRIGDSHRGKIRRPLTEEVKIKLRSSVSKAMKEWHLQRKASKLLLEGSNNILN